MGMLLKNRFKQKARSILLLIAAISSILLFIGITYMVLSGWNGSNRELLVWINVEHSSQAMDILMPTITILGDIPFWVILILCVWRFDKKMLSRSTRKKTTVLLAVALCIATLVALMLQQLFAVARPNEIEGLRLLIWKDTLYGYPSAHATRGFAAVSISLFFLKKRFAVPTLFLAAAVAYSRVYVGVHYPFDVIAGVCLGVFIAILLLLITQKELSKNNNYLKS